MHTEQQEKWNNYDIPIKCPCKDCKNHNSTCHINCKGYLDFAQELKNRRSARTKYYKDNNTHTAKSRRQYSDLVGKARYFNIKGGSL